MGMRYQPQGLLRIDRNNPLTRGLVFAAVPGGPELISGVLPVRIGGASIGVTEQGRAFATASNTADGWSWPIPASHPLYTITIADSLFVLMKRASAAGFGNVFSVPYRSGAWASPYYAWGLSVQSDTTQAAYSFATGSASRSSASSATGLFANNVAARAQGHTRNGATVRFYLGAVQYGADATTGTGTPDWANKQPPCLFNRGAIAGEGTNGQANLVLVWSRELSATEWKSISENPWQIFEDASDEDGLMSAAAGAPNSYTLTAAPGTFGISGPTASLRVTRTLVGSNGSFSLTGTPAVLRAGRRVVGATGVITLAGGAAGLAVSRKLAGAPGAFVLASAAAALRASRALATSTGTFAISGSGGSLRVSRRVSAAPAAFALAGADARLTAVRRLVADAGAFMLSGGAAQLVYSPVVEGNVLFTETGQFVLTGSAVGMRVMRRLQAGSGSFGHAGAVATIRCSRRMAGGQGAFVVASGAAVLRVTRRLSLAPGAFDLAGNPAVLAYGSTIEYARAPAGSGYTPQRNEYQARPAQVGGSRQAAIQRNIR